MSHKSYSEFETRHQIRDFAHTLDAVSYILRKLDMPLHKLRDVVDGLQGAAGGRHEFELSFLSLARRLRHAGSDETAATYAQRKVAALDKEQHKAGRLLFTIERGGGAEHRRTRYIDHLTLSANWMMQQARASDLWAKHPGKAIEAFTDAAIEMLSLAETEKNNSLPNPMTDDDYISRNLSHLMTLAEKNYQRLASKGDDPVAHAEKIARLLVDRAKDVSNLQRIAHEKEGVQICTPSESALSEAATEEKPEMRAALDYAIYDDLPVFPCRSDKSPYTSNGFKDATRDEATIRHLWRKWPDAQIGIPTGEASGWLVLDIDQRHGGDASLSELIEAHGELPQTLEARTGGGGYHIIFQYPKGSNIRNSAGKLGEGIDVRAEGGYIIVAPSLHASGRRYEWQNNYQPAPVPEFLFKLLTEEKHVPEASRAGKARSEAKSGAAIEGLINEGQRNETLFRRVAAPEAGRGSSYEEIEAAVIEVNERQCSPPLDVDECRKIARSAYTLESRKRVAVGA
jgi:hypothetical protein